MFKCLGIIFGTVGAAIRCRLDLVTENLALPQQLAVMKYQCPRDSRSPTQIVSSGRFCRESSRAGVPHCTLFSRIPSFAGIGKGFAVTGAGKGGFSRCANSLDLLHTQALRNDRESTNRAHATISARARYPHARNPTRCNGRRRHA